MGLRPDDILFINGFGLRKLKSQYLSEQDTGGRNFISSLSRTPSKIKKILNFPKKILELHELELQRGKLHETIGIL